MPPLFWSGKLTLPMKLLVEANNILSLFTRSSGDIRGMKNRVRSGYEGNTHIMYSIMMRSATIFKIDQLEFSWKGFISRICKSWMLAVEQVRWLMLPLSLDRKGLFVETYQHLC
jgi:hypothetical protein